MNFYAIHEAASAIAAKMHPCNEKNRTEATQCYVAALANAVETDAIIYRDPVTRLPLQRVGIAATLAAHSCVVSEMDLNAWLGTQGVGIEVDGAAGACAGRNPVRSNENPETRRARLLDRKLALIAMGTRNFNKKLAEEEGVTVARIQQDLRVPKREPVSVNPWKSLIHRH
jgi:hypothetical protein